ncbi:MAG: ChaN family lipoprotein [Bacteroidia bacterium]|nr:ChaN family lipoprotein [Bacteroidia bacterium]
MNRKFRTFLVPGVALIFILSAFTPDKPAYQLFTAKGKRSSYSAMLKKAADADIVLFGEFHNNPMSHWLELELTRDLHAGKRQIEMGAEMFEADVQSELDRYMQDTAFTEKDMMKVCRAWPNYRTDYKPLVEFAKDKGIRFVACNVPRKFASMLYKGGLEALDTLTTEQKSWMAPLPFPYDSTLPCYRDIYKATGGHGGQRLPMSQALKDATMAHFILKNHQKGKIFIHYNGSYHSNNFESIYWYLKKADPSLKIMTIGSTEQAHIQKLDKESLGLADFILCTPESMTKTYEQ